MMDCFRVAGVSRRTAYNQQCVGASRSVLFCWTAITSICFQSHSLSVMRLILPLLLLLCSLPLLLSAEPATERHLESKERRFDPKAEVAAFYLHLLAHDPAAKRQFDLLARKALSYGDVHFGTDAPQVVEWFPRIGAANAGVNFSTDTHFLVIQPLAFSRPQQHDYQLAVVSEFHVLHTGKTHYEPPDKEERQKLDSNEITIRFLGFRQFKLMPLK